MGGYGSGRWTRKTTAEECLFIDINEIVRSQSFRDGQVHVFAKTRTGLRKRQAATVGTKLHRGKTAGRVLRLQYRVKVDGEWQDVDELIALQTTQPHYGGARWWFTCPLTMGEVSCERRMGKLFLSPGALYFGCRRCYDLTYRSCQESHLALYKWVAEQVPGMTEKQVRRTLFGL